MNRRVPNGTHGGVRGRKSPMETFSYSIGGAGRYVGCVVRAPAGGGSEAARQSTMLSPLVAW